MMKSFVLFFSCNPVWCCTFSGYFVISLNQHTKKGCMCQASLSPFSNQQCRGESKTWCSLATAVMGWAHCAGQSHSISRVALWCKRLTATCPPHTNPIHTALWVLGCCANSMHHLPSVRKFQMLRGEIFHCSSDAPTGARGASGGGPVGAVAGACQFAVE